MPALFALRFHGRSLPVGEPIVIGRSPHCDLVLSHDPNVSRAHARLTPDGAALLVEDLGSVNGVFVNGVRLRLRAKVFDGDIVRIGSCVVTIVGTGRTKPDMPAVRGRDETDTLRLLRPAVAPNLPSKPRHQAFLRSADEAEPALDAGAWTRASQLLDPAAWALVDEVAATGALDPIVQERACTCAVRLATATRDGMWVNFLLSLHTAASRPMPRAVAATLPRLVHASRNVEIDAVEAYLDVMRTVYPRLMPVERQLCGSLESARLLVSLLRI